MDTLLSPPDDAVLIAGEHETVPGYGPHRLAVSGTMASVERLYETASARLDKAAGKDDAEEAKDALRHARSALILLATIEVQVSAFMGDLASLADRVRKRFDLFPTKGAVESLMAELFPADEDES
jgi:hypothetical protein